MPVPGKGELFQFFSNGSPLALTEDFPDDAFCAPESEHALRIAINEVSL